MMVRSIFALPAHAAPKAKRIAVVNSKGGTGKSTIATNLAAFYARKKLPTTLYDFDPQESSVDWLAQRADDDIPITGVRAARKPAEGTTRSWQLRAPAETRRVIIDTPAGVAGEQLAQIVRSVDCLVIPIAPSPMENRATARFVSELLLSGKVRQQNVRVAVVANRFRANSDACEELARFLHSLNIPIAATLSESKHYLDAAGEGLGVHDMSTKSALSEQRNWIPLIQWLEQDDSRVVPWAQLTHRRLARPVASLR